jgi:hypothetical protein
MNILEKANEIVNLRSEEKERMYGDFHDSMRKTSEIASIISNKKIDVNDCYNVLIALKLEDCVNSAYNVISKRTGKMINGTFIKNK